MIIKSINNTYGYKGLPDGFRVEFDDEVTYVVGDNFKTKSTILSVPLWVFTGYNMAGSNQEELADDRRNNLRYVMAEISFVDDEGELHTLSRKKGRTSLILLDGVSVTTKYMAKFYKDIQFFLCSYNPYRFNSLSDNNQQELLLRLLPAISKQDAFNLVSEEEQKIINDPIENNKSYAQSKRADIKNLQFEIERYEGQIDAIIPTIMMKEDEKKEFDKQERLEFLENEYEKILNDTNYITDVEEIQRRIKVLNQEIKKTLEEDLEKAKKRKKELEDKLANTHICYTCKQEIQNETMIKNIERLDRKELENLTEDIKRKLEASKEKLNQIKKLKETYETLNTEECKMAIKSKEEIKQEIDSLKQEKNDIDNFNKMADNKKSMILNAKRQMEDLNKKIDECKEKIELYNSQIKISNKMRMKIIQEQLKETEGFFTDISLQFFTYDSEKQDYIEDYKLLYKGREYAKLSQSEKMRADFEISNFINRKSGINTAMFIDDTERIRDIKIADGTQVVMALYIKYSELDILYEYNDVLKKKKYSIEQQLRHDEDFVYLNAA